MCDYMGFTGYVGAGKDAAASILVAEFGFVRIGFADPIKEMLLAIDPIVCAPTPEGGEHWGRLSTLVAAHGWDKAKRLPEVRRLLQATGTEAGRGVLGEDVWVEAAMRRAYAARYCRSDGRRPGIVFPDVRYPNEAAAVRDRGGRLYRIERPGVGPVNGHSSERPAELAVDGVIANAGALAALRAALAAMIPAGRPISAAESRPKTAENATDRQNSENIFGLETRQNIGFFAFFGQMPKYFADFQPSTVA